MCDLIRCQANGRTCGAKQTDDGRCAEQNAGDQDDVHQPASEIVQLAAEDQHPAGNGDGREGDVAGDRSSDGFLDLLERPFPWKTAAGAGESRRRSGDNR